MSRIGLDYFDSLTPDFSMLPDQGPQPDFSLLPDQQQSEPDFSLLPDQTPPPPAQSGGMMSNLWEHVKDIPIPLVTPFGNIPADIGGMASRTGEFLKGMGEFGLNVFKSSQGNPVASNELGRGLIEPALKAQREDPTFAANALAAFGGSPYSTALAAPGLTKIAAETIGMNPENIQEDWRNKRVGALVGDIVPPLAAAGLMHYVGGLGEEARPGGGGSGGGGGGAPTQLRLPGMERTDFGATMPESQYVKPPVPPPDTPQMVRARAFAEIDGEYDRKTLELKILQSQASTIGDHAKATTLDNDILQAKIDMLEAKRNWQPPPPPEVPPAPVFPDTGEGMQQPNLAMNLGPNRVGGRFAPEPAVPPDYGGGTLGPPIATLPTPITPTSASGITPQMRADLTELGLTDEAINKMTPQQAHEFINVIGDFPPRTTDVPSSFTPTQPVGTGSAFEQAMRASLEQDKGPEVVTTYKITKEKLAELRAKGYKSVPGLRDENNAPMVMRGDVDPAEYFRRQATQGPIRPGAKTIPPTEEGAIPLSEIPKKFITDDSGTFDPQQMWENLKKLLRRTPTQAEVDAAMSRQPRVGEETGRIADFPHPDSIERAVIDARRERPQDIADIEAANTPEVLRDLFGHWADRKGQLEQLNMPDDVRHANDMMTRIAHKYLDMTGPRPPAPPLPPNPMGARVDAGFGGPRAFDFRPPERPYQPTLPGTTGPTAELRGRSQLENISNAPKAENVDLGPQPTQRSFNFRPAKSGLREFGEPTDKPLFARVQGGGLTASVDIRRAVENITKDYTSPLPGIMAREGLQNALDAADKLGMKGTVRIRMDEGAKTIEIHDNGSGLDEDGLAHKLVEIFATGKEGEAGATGGKGIGSASYIYGGQHFEVESIAVDRTDGMKYRITASGTPDQFLDPVKGSEWDKVLVSKDTPTGTTIKVLLKDTHDMADAQAMVGNIVDNSRNRPSSLIVDETGLTSGRPLRDVRPGEIGVDTHKFEDSSKDKLVGDFTTTNRNSDVKVLVPKFDPNVPRDRMEVHYLNNGMYQFSESMHLGDTAEGVPDRVLIDIHPLVDDQNELYPFINTREDIKRDIREEVTKYVRDNIAKPGITKRKNRIQELYDTMTPVNVGNTARKSIIFDPGERLTGNEMQSITRNPVIKQLIQTYDKLMNNILTSVRRPEWADRLEGVGLVFDPNMHGVHIPNPSSGKSTILINPFIRIGDSSLTPFQTSWENTITNLHEAAHIGSEHGTPIQLNPSDLSDPRLGEFLSSYMNQIVKHGDIGMWASTGHGMDFAHRLGEVYAKFGVDATFKAASEIHDILTGGRKSGGYSPEIQSLLQLYNESRGRAATTEDLLSGTGVKQADRGPNTEGNIPGDNTTNGDGVATKVKDLFSRFIGDESGTFSPGKMWQNVKEKTGIGGTPEPPKPIKDPVVVNGRVVSQELVGKAGTHWIDEALGLGKTATTLADFSAMKQTASQFLTPEFWGGVKRMVQAGWSPELDAAIHKEILKKPMFQHEEVNGVAQPSWAQKVGFKLIGSGDISTRSEMIGSSWYETGRFGNVPDNPISRSWAYVMGRLAKSSTRAFRTQMNYVAANRLEFLADRMADMSGRAATGEKVPRPGILGGANLSDVRLPMGIDFSKLRGTSADVGFGLKHDVTLQQAADMNPYTNLVLGRALSDFVRTVTGQAPLKMHILPTRKAEWNLESSAKALTRTLFAPRNLATHFRMLNPNTYAMAPPFIRKQYLKAALASTASWLAITKMMQVVGQAVPATGIKVSWDPENADFGKIRIGNTRLDFGQGYLPFLTMMYRWLSGHYVSSSTGLRHQYGQGFNAQTQLGQTGRTLVGNKLEPFIAFATDLMNASENQPFHMMDRAMQLAIPMAAQDMWDISHSEPWMLPFAAGPILAGAASQTYGRKAQPRFIPSKYDLVIKHPSLGMGLIK